MTTPHPETIRRRLERAGYACLKDLWVPVAYAAKVRQQAGMHREDVERIAAEPPKPRGRPRKSG